ncbi:MAG TPA: VWA domain-containing protein, partial [Terriglobales bacterium]|nr:VWA domain-containing protein [Terriglobales bacterium]
MSFVYRPIRSWGTTRRMRRVLAFLLICMNAFTQTSAGGEGSRKDEPADFVVRINVNLVQVDAAVTDARGRTVTGLTAKDFEVLQDGVPQTITSFGYVAEAVKSTPLPRQSAVKADSIVPAPRVPLKPEQLRREIVFMVDDLGLSPTGVTYTRTALKKFVDRDMQPGDMVAIVRTGGGPGALQQFATDKQVLYSAIDQLKIHFMARAASFASTDFARGLEAPSEGPGQSLAQDNLKERYAQADAEEKCFEDTNSTLGSLAAIRYVVQGLRNFPGRKALILLSQKLKVSDRPDSANSDKSCEGYSRAREILRKLTDDAERSAVVIYTIDPHGLDPLVMDAQSNPFAGGPVRSGTA